MGAFFKSNHNNIISKNKYLSIYTYIYSEAKMKKNLYALKLAGLLKEELGPPQPGTDDQSGGEDPAALLDQAIELLNKVKESLGGGGGAEPGSEPGGMGDQGGMGAAPGGPPGMM